MYLEKSFKGKNVIFLDKVVKFIVKFNFNGMVVFKLFYEYYIFCFVYNKIFFYFVI